MAVSDPYAPCPCGSGQKLKWCCHKVEPFAEKAHRLYDEGQLEAALSKLDEGLRTSPGNPWLTVRKALYLIVNERASEARPILDELVLKRPQHVNGQLLLIQATYLDEGPQEGAAQLQRALAALQPEHRARLFPVVELIGSAFLKTGQAPAARKHLELAAALSGDEEQANPEIATYLRALEQSPSISPWLRHDYALAPPPDGLDPAVADRFLQALGWAGEGLWEAAAAAFDALAADGIAVADRNQGLCRLWLADVPPAVAALRRYLATAQPSEDAVDLEALCQIIAPVPKSERVALVHWSWALRDRERLLEALRASDRAHDEGPGLLGENDSKDARVNIESFAVLDRPKPAELPAEPDPRQLPQLVAHVLVAPDTVILEGYDDGRLDRLSNWLSDLAGPAMPPAHPKSREIAKLARADIALQPHCWYPPDLDDHVLEALEAEKARWIATELWPKVPRSYLGGRSPEQAGHDARAEVPLRAALCLLESSNSLPSSRPIDFPALRARIGVPDEPPIDPDTVDLERLHLGRLFRVPAERLDDDRLIEFYERAHDAGLVVPVSNAARALVARPALLGPERVDRAQVYSDLANASLANLDADEAFAWIARGRDADPAGRTANAAVWDLAELRLQSRARPPEELAANLAILLERYANHPSAGSLLLSTLLDLGLARFVRNPDSSQEVLLDTRPLQAFLSEYGPRVTTASGALGISATKGDIWVPGSETGGTTAPGGLWSPGAPAEPRGEKKLILPG